MQFRLAVCLPILAILLAGIGGCTSTTDVLGSATTGIDGNVVSNTGTYPTFATSTEAAASQMSEEDAARMGAELEALALNSRGAGISEAEYKRRMAELRKLAKTHADTTAQEIEN